MNILVTGANGFIGKHMTMHLSRAGHTVFSFDIDNTDEELKQFISQADFIVHLAGINRPLTIEEFYDGNSNFTAKVVYFVKKSKKINWLSLQNL